MSNRSTYTLVLTVDAEPRQISWFVTDRSQKVLVQSNSSEFAQLKPFATIVNNITLLEDGSLYYFNLQNYRGNGINCQQPICYNVTVKNLTDSQLLFFKGDGKFTCQQQYYLGLSAPQMQQPLNKECQSFFGNPYIAPDVLYYQILAAILGLFILSIIIWRIIYGYQKRTRDREDDRQRQEDRELDTEFQGKLNDARKESIQAVLPKLVLKDYTHTSVMRCIESSALPDLSDLERTQCPICLDPFHSDQEICWSPNTACRHIFHSECILDWLFRKDDQVCPVCRNEFLVIPV